MSNSPLHDRVAESFQRQRLLATLGARLLRVADGEVDIELPWSEAIQQQHGFVHWTPLELFRSGVQGLPATIRAALCQAATG